MPAFATAMDAGEKVDTTSYPQTTRTSIQNRIVKKKK